MEEGGREHVRLERVKGRGEGENGERGRGTRKGKRGKGK